jgi:cytoskeletal protein CcmA (bactofilin family)
MSESARNDVTVNGGGTIAAGAYENVTINGAGTITGDITCTSLRVNGVGTCRGAVKAAKVNTNGTTTFEGPVQVSELTVNGDASIRAGLGVGTLVLRGNLSVDGGINAREIDVKGALRAGGDVTADVFRGEGTVVAGDVHVETFDLAVYGSSKVAHLEAERAVLRAPGSLAEMLMFFSEKQFIAETIRAREAWLEHTVANVVSAGNVTVGRASRIGLVHYSGTYSQVDNALVSEARKAEPPA